MKVACVFFEKCEPLGKVAELFLGFSPQIAIRGQEAIFIEIGKCQELYSADDFFIKAQAILQRHGYGAKIVFGENVTDALALARFKKASVDHLPLEALLDFVDPFGRDAAVCKMALRLIESFKDLGVRNLGDFKKIPSGELSARFAALGRFCHSRINLVDFISWPAWAPEEIIVEEKEFPFFEFYGELDPILFELKIQIDRIFARLKAREKRLTSLQVDIRCEKISVHPNFLRTFKFDFFAPQSVAKGTLRILHERLQNEFSKSPIRSPIEALTTKVIRAVCHSDSQKNFFNNDDEKFEQLHSVHNQLVELLGKENIYQAQLTEDRRPENSWRPSFESPHQIQSYSFNINEVIPERPTYLLRKLIPVEVTAGFIHIQKKRYRILHWYSGVERISGAWYEKPGEEIKDVYHRNYYQVVIEKNQKIMIFETLDKKFFLHGYFG